MDYKLLIKTQLDLLKKMGKSRSDIETDLNYAKNYINVALSRGGNEKLFQTLNFYRENLEDHQNVASEDPAKYVTQQELVDLQKQVISDLRLEKLELLQKVQAMEAKISSLESRNEYLEVKAAQNIKKQRSA